MSSSSKQMLISLIFLFYHLLASTRSATSVPAYNLPSSSYHHHQQPYQHYQHPQYQLTQASPASPSEQIAAPTITPFAFSAYVEERQRASVLCTIASGDLNGLTISWLKDGQPVSPSMALARNITVRSDSYESALKFAPVKLEHAGNYTCVARNRAGFASHSAQLQVFAEPRWSLREPPKPGPLTAIRGQTIVIDCQTVGYPKPTQSWQIKTHSQSEFEPLAATGRISLAANGSLVIRNADKSDEANYLCRSSNGIGKGISWSTSLKVTVPAHFEWSGRQQTSVVRKQGQVQLRCDAFGDEPISIEWYKNKSRLNNDLDPRYSINNQPIQNGLLSVLYIKNAQRSDNSLFECVTRNLAGRDRMPIELVVQEEPDLISDLQTTNQVNSRSVTLAWTEPYDGRSAITEYMFQFKKLANVDAQQVNSAASSEMMMNSAGELILLSDSDPSSSLSAGLTRNQLFSWSLGDSDWQQAARLTLNASSAIMAGAPSGMRSISIEQLEPSSRYLLRALAKNSFGQSKFSQPMEFSTAEEPPELVPGNVRAVALNSTSVHVSWDAAELSAPLRSPPSSSSSSSPSGRILGYYVGYRQVSATTGFAPAASGNISSFLTKPYLINDFTASSPSALDQQPQRLDFIVNDLRRDTLYEFTVLAFNARGSGPSSEFVQCRTIEMEAPKAVKVQVMRESNESIFIEWQRDPNDQNPVDDYVIYQEKNSASQEWTQIRLPGNQSQYKAPGLKCGTRYQFYIVAQNKVGKSAQSEVISASTSGALPAIPSKVSLIKMLNSTCLQVNLNAFQDVGCRIKSFNVRYRIAKNSLLSSSTNSNGASISSGTTTSTSTGTSTTTVTSGHLSSSGSNSAAGANSVHGNSLLNSAGLSASHQALVNAGALNAGAAGTSTGITVDSSHASLHKQPAGIPGGSSSSLGGVVASGNDWIIVRPKGAAKLGQWALDHEDRVEYLCDLNPLGEYNIHVSASNDVGRSEVEYTVLMSSDELRPSLIKDLLELLSSGLSGVFTYVPSLLVFLLVALFLSLLSLILYTTVVKYYQKFVIMQNQIRASRRAKRDEKRRRKLNNSRHSQKQLDLWADEYDEDEDDEGGEDDEDADMGDGDDEDDGDDSGRLSGISTCGRNGTQHFLTGPTTNHHYISNITNSGFDTSSCNKFSGSTCTRSTASTDSIHGRFQCLNSKQYVKMNEYTMLPSISASLSPPSDIYGISSGASSQHQQQQQQQHSVINTNNNNSSNNINNNSLYYSTLRRSSMQTYLPQRQQANQQPTHRLQATQQQQQQHQRSSQNQVSDIYGYYVAPPQGSHQSNNLVANQSLQNPSNEVVNSIFVPPQQIIYSAPNIRRQPVFL